MEKEIEQQYAVVDEWLQRIAHMDVGALHTAMAEVPRLFEEKAIHRDEYKQLLDAISARMPEIRSAQLEAQRPALRAKLAARIAARKRR